MSSPPSGIGSVELRPVLASEIDALQAVWEASTLEDDPVRWPRGGWSLAAWATHTCALVLDGRIVGVVAVRAEPAPDGAMPAGMALDRSARLPELAERLVAGAVDLIRQLGGPRARLLVPALADWLHPAVRRAGFRQVRTIAHMLLPAHTPTPIAPPRQGWSVRSIGPDEDDRVLAALNRAWAGTWNFVEITPDMLRHDLEGQRDGMLLGVLELEPERIIATCHAVFEPGAQNPDGAPRAWISNLTVDPDFRGRGIARSMLAAGIAHLRSRGASSITLGVDADDPAPFRLYQSVGFEIASTLEAWDAPVGTTNPDL